MASMAPRPMSSLWAYTRSISRVRLEERLHHLLAALTGEVAGLRGDDLELRVGEDAAEALGAVERRRRAGGALELDDVDVVGVGELLGDPLAGPLALDG